MSSKIASVCGYTCAKIYGKKIGYIKAYPIDGYEKQNLGDSLLLIIQYTGVMQKLHTKNPPKSFGRNTPLSERARKEGINITAIEPNHPDENYSENIIGKEKLGYRKIVVRK